MSTALGWRSFSFLDFLLLLGGLAMDICGRRIRAADLSGRCLCSFLVVCNQSINDCAIFSRFWLSRILPCPAGHRRASWRGYCDAWENHWVRERISLFRVHHVQGTSPLATCWVESDERRCSKSGGRSHQLLLGPTLTRLLDLSRVRITLCCSTAAIKLRAVGFAPRCTSRNAL